MSGTRGSVLQWLRLENSDSSDTFFSCLAVISTCTFVVLHLTVPAPHSNSTPSFFLKRWWDTRIMSQLRRQLCWAVVIIIAPELLISLAFGSWRAEWIGFEAFQNFGRKNVKDWTRRHASFANMGGLKFEMQKGGQEIPDLAVFRERGFVIDIVRVREQTQRRRTVQDIAFVFNRMQRKLGGWWQKVSNWSVAALRPIAQFLWGIFEKRNAQESEMSRTESPTDSYNEMTILDRTGVYSRSGLTNKNSLNDNREESHTMSSASRSPSGSGEAIGLNGNVDRHDNEEDREQEDTRQSSHDDTIILHLNAAQIVVAQTLGILDEAHVLSKEDIDDKSKANAMVKSFTALHILWFATRVVAQLCQSKRITQLELASCTYILCALFAYVLYGSRPQGVERPINHCVPVSDNVRAVTDQDLAYLKMFGGSPFLTRNFVPPFGMDENWPDPAMPVLADISLTAFTNLGPGYRSVVLYDDDFAGIITGTVFGALYCLGWNQAFPSPWEKWAWRTSSVIITGSLIPYSIVNLACTYAFSHLSGKTHVVHCLALYSLLGLYISCRVFMLVEMIRTLFLMNNS